MELEDMVNAVFSTIETNGGDVLTITYSLIQGPTHHAAIHYQVPTNKAEEIHETLKGHRT